MLHATVFNDITHCYCGKTIQSLDIIRCVLYVALETYPPLPSFLPFYMSLSLFLFLCSSLLYQRGLFKSDCFKFGIASDVAHVLVLGPRFRFRLKCNSAAVPAIEFILPLSLVTGRKREYILNNGARLQRSRKHRDCER